MYDAAYYTMGRYEDYAVSRWNSAKEGYLGDHFIDKDRITAKAQEILGHFLGGVGALCAARYRNNGTEPEEISFPDKIQELEKMFLKEEILEMFVISGEKAFERLLDNMAGLSLFYQEETREAI